MECDDIGLGSNGFKRYKSPCAFLAGAWRVAEQHLEAELSRPSLHNASHMPHTHYAKREPMAIGDTSRLHVPCNHRVDILRHSRSITTWCVHGSDAVFAAESEVDVVGAYGGSAHKAATAA